MTATLLAGVFTAKDVLGKSFTDSLDPLKDSLICIHSEGFIGVGFIASMAGQQYIFTHLDNVSGYKTIHFKTLNGIPVRPQKFETCPTRGIVRFLVSDQQALTLISPVKDEQIAVLEYGTSPEIDSRRGSITEIKRDIVNISAPFPAASHGGPVMNKQFEVSGIASHSVSDKAKGKKWNKTAHRFAEKFDGAEWQVGNWELCQKYGEVLNEADVFRLAMYRIVTKCLNNPRNPIKSKENLGSDFARWAKMHNDLLADLPKISRDSYDQKNVNGISRPLHKANSRFRENMRLLIRTIDLQADSFIFSSKNKKLTPYQSNQLKWRALELQRFSEYLNTHVKEMKQVDWFKGITHVY